MPSFFNNSKRWRVYARGEPDEAKWYADYEQKHPFLPLERDVVYDFHKVRQVVEEIANQDKFKTVRLVTPNSPNPGFVGAYFHSAEEASNALQLCIAVFHNLTAFIVWWTQSVEGGFDSLSTNSCDWLDSKGLLSYPFVGTILRPESDYSSCNPRQWILDEVPVFVHGSSALDSCVYSPSPSDRFVHFNTFIINYYVMLAAKEEGDMPEEMLEQMSRTVTAMSLFTEYLAEIEWVKVQDRPHQIAERMTVAIANGIIWASTSEPSSADGTLDRIIIHRHRILLYKDHSIRLGLTLQAISERVPNRTAPLSEIQECYAPTLAPCSLPPPPRHDQLSTVPPLYPYLEFLVESLEYVTQFSFLDFTKVKDLPIPRHIRRSTSLPSDSLSSLEIELIDPHGHDNLETYRHLNGFSPAFLDKDCSIVLEQMRSSYPGRGEPLPNRAYELAIANWGCIARTAMKCMEVYLKYFANCYPMMDDIDSLLCYTLCFGLCISLAILDDWLGLFHDAHRDLSREQTHLLESEYILHYRERHLQDRMTPHELTQKFIQNVKWMARGSNVASLLSLGGVEVWVMQHWGGAEVYEKWFHRMSDLVLYHHILQTDMEDEDCKFLIREHVFTTQRSLVVGMVVSPHDSTHRTILPGTFTLWHYYQPYFYEWNEACSKLLNHIVTEIIELGAQARSEEEWKDYLATYYYEYCDPSEYCIKSEDVSYGIELMKVGYPADVLSNGEWQKTSGRK
ncbi:hypothetical protein EV421DRAFT_1939688 [Armillaria borealis]|uniref:Uncharacterized protein n=1 Tax=Armillaria borealis TaxID=47425 RepID=A0AA39IT02_9AGAR|nr:hypothetical protein EV421DRAFT_1939688 [Armillaria borealis]